MLIYQLVFGTDSGQVRCCFHDDSRASSGIGPNGEFNCFVCGSKAHNEIGFIAKYFNTGLERATKIANRFKNLQKYSFTKNEVTSEQRNFLNGIGIKDEIINKYFFCSAVGKLMYDHKWNGISVGYTWFNHPTLSNYNASADKYKYDKNNSAGMLTPYDDVVRYPTLVITEGEKDMLVAKSNGIVNAVAKIGGAKSYGIGGLNLHNKNVVIVYDCDEWGREGAVIDADYFTEKFNCKVKIVDLGLQEGEDLADYFNKYGKTQQDFVSLMQSTAIHVPVPKKPEDKFLKYVSTLSKEDCDLLENILKQKRKGELQ